MGFFNSLIFSKINMPLYETVMVCRVGEAQALQTNMRTLCSMVLSKGGVVRSFDNLGDRVLVKHLRAKDGQRYALGRFVQVQFDASPALKDQVEAEMRTQSEVLRVNTNKIKEWVYL